MWSLGFGAGLIALGVVTGGIGVYLYRRDEGPTGMTRDYEDYKTPGIICMAAGGVAVIGGLAWILATPNHDGPTVGALPGGGATMGWIGRF